jgi:hypothetical protein
MEHTLTQPEIRLLERDMELAIEVAITEFNAGADAADRGEEVFQRLDRGIGRVIAIGMTEHGTFVPAIGISSETFAQLTAATDLEKQVEKTDTAHLEVEKRLRRLVAAPKTGVSRQERARLEWIIQRAQTTLQQIKILNAKRGEKDMRVWLEGLAEFVM